MKHDAIANGAIKKDAIKNDAINILQKQKKTISEKWLNNLLAAPNLREDLMSIDDLNRQSEELLYSFIDSLNDQSMDDSTSGSFDRVNEILSGISISRAKQGFTPRETGAYIFSLKGAILETL